MSMRVFIPVIRFRIDTRNMHYCFVYFLIIWKAFLIQHLKCSCTSITLAVSPIINNLLGTESAGINGFGPE